jgi:hypothetical protein
MTATAPNMNHHPAPRPQRARLHETFFALFGGPIAWFVQLCGGYALASEPCFRAGQRTLAPAAGLYWTWPGMIGLMLAAISIALLSLLVSWRAFRRTRDEALGDPRHLMESGAGRTRFLALWGMALGTGFALTAAFTAVAFMTLPRCAG